MREDTLIGWSAGKVHLARFAAAPPSDGRRIHGGTILCTLQHHEELTRLRDRLSRWCEELGIAFVDVTDTILPSQAADLYVESIHPGPAGQRIIAEAVFETWFGNEPAQP